ncbi:hypothetical protein GUJ93_ZPchr0007g3285 [Zizania palustris]|uniref:Uncharacterized protein n=1 Tax=Zizania palustris TaxID=103762 RepID=A0A8J5SU10_ZIZPA|nr:hypothetical protein GUJ93_ZPchr0007g3285 [Zizania palustris]
MEASGSGGAPGQPWMASATRAPAGGAAVEDVPLAVVLDRPAPDGEFISGKSMRFTGCMCKAQLGYMKYTIRLIPRIAVRIIYVLWTVRCGCAVKKPLPSAEESMTQWISDASTSEKHEQETKSVSSSIDEDSWVEVKIPELPVEKNIPKSQEPNAIVARQETALTHYEATAEITDASPCVSLTIRLLSLQSKISVHTEEIYIFADPIELINVEPETRPRNMGENNEVPLVKNQRVSRTDRPVSPLMDENLNPYSHIEGKLDTLLSKLDKMESYCSRMLAPDGLPNMAKSHNDGKVGSSAFATNTQPGLVISAPDFSLEESFSYDKSNENSVALQGSTMVPKLLVKAPDFICEFDLTHEKLHYAPFSSVDFALSSDKEYKASPSLVVKVPEFPNDEDNEVDQEKEAEVGDYDDGHRKSDDALSKSTIGSSKSKTDVSVDGALASALAALLSSTKQTSCLHSVSCPASNSTAKNTDESSTCSFSPEHVDDISTKDGLADQFYSTSSDANKIDTFISYQEAYVDPHTSLSKANLDEKVEVNGWNNDLNSNMMAFVASTEPLCVSSQLHTVDESIDVGSQENRQNDGCNSGMMSSVANTERSIAPPHSPTVVKSIDDGAQSNDKFDNRPTLSLTEFLVARNANSCKNVISMTLCGNDGVETHTFKRISAGSAKNLKDINQLLLVKKALEVNEDDSAMLGSSRVNPTAGDEYKDDMLEGEISDADTYNDDEARFTVFGSARLISALSSSEDEAPATDEPFVDVVNLPTPAVAYVFSRNELLDNGISPLNPSGTCASVVSEHLTNDESKHSSGTLAAEGSGEHPDSSIWGQFTLFHS